MVIHLGAVRAPTGIDEKKLALERDEGLVLLTFDVGFSGFWPGRGMPRPYGDGDRWVEIVSNWIDSD